MDIVLIGQMSGTRNGKDWPPAGTRLDLPDDEARGLIRSGMAAEPDDERVRNLGNGNGGAPFTDEFLAGAPEGRDWTEGQPDTNLARARMLALDERENRLIAREAAARAQLDDAHTVPGAAGAQPGRAVVGDDKPNPTDQPSPLSVTREVGGNDGPVERTDGAGVTVETAKVESAEVDPDAGTERATVDTSTTRRGARAPK